MKSTTVAPALKVLLENFIDYAGIFPPATLTLDAAVSNYESYRAGGHSWMLRWLVVSGSELERIPSSLDGRLSVLSDADEPRATCVESKTIIPSASKPVYCELAASEVAKLDAVKSAGCFAKIRMGGVKSEAIPSTFDVASFILACANRRLPFKATAGLHHPIRAEHNLTYEPNAPRAVMHGFLNLLMASAFAWHGERDIEPILAEFDPQAFNFDDRAHWKDKSLAPSQLREARTHFLHSIGSCSFEEPVEELHSLGLL